MELYPVFFILKGWHNETPQKVSITVIFRELEFFAPCNNNSEGPYWLGLSYSLLLYRPFWAEISECLDGVSVSTSFAQSQLVSVLTSIKFPNLDESRSQHQRNLSVLMSLSLDIQEIFQSRWVSVSTSKKFLSLDESRYQHPRTLSDLMSLGLDIQ